MKLLFDQNISYRIVRLLYPTSPDCKHVSDVGLNGKSDFEICDYARVNNFIIVSFDAIFMI